MQTNIVRAKDLINMYPNNYTTMNKKCPKCGGAVYSTLGIALECENIIYKNGRVWESSPCDYHLMSG